MKKAYITLIPVACFLISCASNADKNEAVNPIDTSEKVIVQTNKTANKITTDTAKEIPVAPAVTNIIEKKIVVQSQTKKEYSHEVEEALTHLDMKATDVNSFSASFNEVAKDPVFGDEIESQGTFLLVRGEETADEVPHYKMRFEYTAPEKSVMVISGKDVYLIAPGMGEPQVSKIEDDATLDAYFSGFMSTDRIRTHYDISLVNSTDAEVTLKLIPLTPQVKKTFKELQVTFSKQTWLPVKIFQHKNNGQQITFTFTQPVTNVDIEENVFTIDGLKNTYSKPYKIE